MTESLQQAAAEDWETEKYFEKSRKPIIVGETFKMSLLFPDASIDVSGEGALHVSIKQSESSPGHQELLVAAKESGREQELPLQIRILYENDQIETMLFTILPRNQVKRNRKLGAWSPWTIFWAGSYNEQRLYHQIPKSTSPNTSSCWSGCGATAWAMLFGWVDYRASFDSAWS
jgi:hypothetical protein